MTDKEILMIAGKHFDYQGGWISDTEDLLKFAKELRKQILEEVIVSLKDVPNPEANRSAINRIMWMQL